MRLGIYEAENLAAEQCPLLRCEVRSARTHAQHGPGTQRTPVRDSLQFPLPSQQRSAVHTRSRSPGIKTGLPRPGTAPCPALPCPLSPQPHRHPNQTSVLCSPRFPTCVRTNKETKRKPRLHAPDRRALERFSGPGSEKGGPAVPGSQYVRALITLPLQPHPELRNWPGTSDLGARV